MRKRLKGITVALGILYLGWTYQEQIAEHKIAIESCSRPVMQLVVVLWMIAVVAQVSSSYGIDVTRVLTNQPHDAHANAPPLKPNLVRDLYLLATTFTLGYFVAAESLHLAQNMAHDDHEWKAFSLGAFIVALGLLGLTGSWLPLPSIRWKGMAGLGRVLFAGMYPVSFSDKLTADYLTSVSKGFGDLVICQCVWRVGAEISDTAEDDWSCVVSFVTPIACALPFMFRFLQCLRVHRDKGETKSLINASKYAIGAICVFCSYLRRRQLGPYPTATYYLVVSINALFSTYWDTVFDFGMFEKDPRTGSWGRRRNSVFPMCSFVIVSLTNFALRISWSLKLVSHSLKGNDSVLFYDGLELFRRTLWTCFRIEFEAHQQWNTALTSSPLSKVGVNKEGVQLGVLEVTA